MRLTTLALSFVSLSFLVVSCKDEARKNAKQERFDEDNFFEDSAAAVALDSFKNEMGDEHTDFLRSFSDDQIPWQKWDSSLLEKAKSAQSPIMVLVGSSLGGDSRNLGAELSETPELRDLVTSQTLCTVVDTLSHPEIGTLSYHLSNELKRSTAFPTLIWLSHEGSPLAWIPIGELSGRDLNVVLENAVAMVEDIWSEYSEYAVENSRSDNEARQKRFDQEGTTRGDLETRDEVFRRATRQLSSLYSFGDRDLDYIGGLVPTNSLELLALGTQSGLLTREVRDQCRKAVSEVTLALTQEAIKDHLDDSYFYARRTSDWSLPMFSKQISSQANIAHMLIRVGSILDKENLISEGLSLLSIIENDWLAKQVSSISPSDLEDVPGKFFWDLKSINQVLTEEEVPLALAAFSIEQDGNIPSAVDPLADFFELNTLRRRTSLDELAKKQQKPLEEIRHSLETISQKLLNHRQKMTKYDSESALTATDLALLLKAQLARAGATGNGADLDTALALTTRLLADYHHPEKGLSRLPIKTSFLAARCSDYAAVSNELLLLYQATLDEKWLKHGLKILDEGVTKLKSENGILSEIPESERIIPLRQHSRTMIFGESSLGVLDLCLNRAWAITGDEKYFDLLEKQSESISRMAVNSPVNHTDYIASCALGSHPLLAVVTGDLDDPNRRKLLTILNSQKYLPFLSVRAAKESETGLASPQDGSGTAITLIRNDQALGTATTGSALKQLLDQIISGS